MCGRIDASKDYCVRVEGDPTLPETQHAAADVAIGLLNEYVANGGRTRFRGRSSRALAVVRMHTLSASVLVQQAADAHHCDHDSQLPRGTCYLRSYAR